MTTSGFDQQHPASSGPPGPRHAASEALPPFPRGPVPAGPPLPDDRAPGRPLSPAGPAADPPAAAGQPPVSGSTGPGTALERSGAWAPSSAELLRVAPRRPAWPGVMALLLVLVLAMLAGVQAHQINQLNNRLIEADQRLAQAQGADAGRFDLVEARTAELERQVGAAFNPEAIAAAVLPSVFRVNAGRFTGTAFAIGDPQDGTDLLTNYHVVESVYLAGNRRVFLERDGQQIEATIAGVDEEGDVALLRSTRSFTGLVTATEPVRSGQQIVVVGAPLGLSDTVTTGVVSAFREAEDGSGPVIQFDAPINPGNSGGPVINSSKQVVGIATAKARDAEGIGLAVPIETACSAFGVC
ncbi:S1C family serine protease [Solwaraspora sp. WMMB335]|uniref:S1C family serine protease n=1 Tax=Solwaraspora sp. WMMB335 TaxID=3404118 RepID=UPI003B965B41